MTTLTFDTFKYVKTLRAAGFDERQAEALVEAQTDVFDKNLEELATRRDLKELEATTKRDLIELENRLVKWVATMFIAQSALIIGAMFAMFRVFSTH